MLALFHYCRQRPVAATVARQEQQLVPASRPRTMAPRVGRRAWPRQMHATCMPGSSYGSPVPPMMRDMGSSPRVGIGCCAGILPVPSCRLSGWRPHEGPTRCGADAGALSLETARRCPSRRTVVLAMTLNRGPGRPRSATSAIAEIVLLAHLRDADQRSSGDGRDTAAVARAGHRPMPRPTPSEKLRRGVQVPKRQAFSAAAVKYSLRARG